MSASKMLNQKSAEIVDKDEAEEFEPTIKRQPDRITAVVTEALGYDPQFCILNKMYRIPVAGSSRPDEIEYDRYYPKIKLLVKSFAVNRKIEGADVQTDASVLRHKEYAVKLGCALLCIIDSRIETSAISKLRDDVAAVA